MGFCLLLGFNKKEQFKSIIWKEGDSFFVPKYTLKMIFVYSIVYANKKQL